MHIAAVRKTIHEAFYIRKQHTAREIVFLDGTLDEQPTTLAFWSGHWCLLLASVAGFNDKTVAYADCTYLLNARWHDTCTAATSSTMSSLSSGVIAVLDRSMLCMMGLGELVSCSRRSIAANVE
jgi:hypothetical protein